MESTQIAVIGVNVGFSLASILAASTRLHRTISKTRKLQVHDLLLLAALVCGVTESMLQCVATRYGLGLRRTMHIPHTDGFEVDTFFKIYLSFFMAYFACNMFVKLSLLAFYRKLAPDSRYDWILWTMAVLAVIFGVGSILSASLSCIPLSKVWDPRVPGVCMNIEAFYYANGAIMIVNDIILYVLPIIIVRGVQLSRARRAAMNLLFGLGFIVVVTSAMRMIAIHDLFSAPRWSLYDQAVLLIWCTVENHLALIIICLPAVKAALVAVAPSLASTPSSLWSRILGGKRASNAGPARRPGQPLDSTGLSATRKSGASHKKGSSSSKGWPGSSFNSVDDTYASTNRTSVVAASPRRPGAGGWWERQRRPNEVDEIELSKDVSVQIMEEGRGNDSFEAHSFESRPSIVEPKEAA